MKIELYDVANRRKVNKESDNLVVLPSDELFSRAVGTLLDPSPASTFDVYTNK